MGEVLFGNRDKYFGDTSYSGYFKGNLPHGEVKIINENEDQYEGDFYNGSPYG